MIFNITYDLKSGLDFKYKTAVLGGLLVAYIASASLQAKYTQ